ncbi:Hydrolase [Aphelenchoides besseyi]|nr:Hydrolase [Aphelenchoides besseyi]
MSSVLLFSCLLVVSNARVLNNAQLKPVPVSNAFDPECNMDVPEIINRWGYPAEEISVVTEDNYILTMHRIPYGRDGPSPNRPVIFFATRIGRQQFLVGFIFADAGFDVYLGNMRGNLYSRDHTRLDPKSHEFWDFSFDEMVKYDLDAQVNEALKRSNQSSLYYVGHSQGTLTMFSKLSRDPIFHRKVEFRRTVKHIKGMLQVLAEFLFDEVKFFYWLFGDGEFIPTNKLFNLIAEYVCESKQGTAFCDNLLTLIMGVDSNQINATRNDVYFTHIPAGTSTKNVQMVRSGILREYDYGWSNEKYYGRNEPPVYDVSQDQCEIYLFWCPDDWLADEADIEGYLIPALKKQYVVKNTKLEDFNHIDFLWGMRAADEVYKPILDAITDDLKKQTNPLD